MSNIIDLFPKRKYSNVCSAHDGLLQWRSGVFQPLTELELIVCIDADGNPVSTAPYICIGSEGYLSRFLLKEVIDLPALTKWLKQKQGK